MAQQILVDVYQINSNPPIPLASVTAISFPTAGISIRGVENATLATGVRVYSAIQVLANNTQYYSMQSQATLVTAANA